MNSLIEIAYKEIGVKEISGTKHNERILQYAKEAGFSDIVKDETPWCSVFMNWVAMKAKMERTKKPNARSWLNIGQKVENPEPGDIVIFWRVDPHSWQGHVGIYLGISFDGARIYTLGGNQGDQVSASAYSRTQLLGFRRLSPTNKIRLSTKVLKNGAAGTRVKELQDALKLAGFNPGTSDGFFGDKTENALKDLQSTREGLEISGIFDRPTRDFLLELLT